LTFLLKLYMRYLTTWLLEQQGHGQTTY
jgi:hypothetical protein